MITAVNGSQDIELTMSLERKLTQCCYNHTHTFFSSVVTKSEETHLRVDKKSINNETQPEG